MSGNKTREELNLKFNDFDTARRIFERLKFQPLAEIVKTRITYQLDDIKIYMDDVEELGCYAEFEILVKDNMEVETA
ncbi:MAG: class IV adenylate cyclase, partial [Candidatus Odinarchaeota archaeon]